MTDGRTDRPSYRDARTHLKRTTTQARKHFRMFIGVMVKSIFAKITDAKRFLCFLMIKNTPAERKSPWDNHKSLRSFSSICTSCSSSHSSNTSSAAQTFVAISGTFPSSWGVFLSLKKHTNRLASVIFAKTDLTIHPTDRRMIILTLPSAA